MAQISTNVIQGKVIRTLSSTELVINLGATHGVRERSRFIIFTLGDEMQDPDTGEALGQLEVVKGQAEAKHVQERMSTIRSVDFLPFHGVQVGDLVRVL
jgi:hypothetical protein